MAHCEINLRPKNGANTPHPVLLDEVALLRSWDRDIKRAARAAGNGGGGDEEDLAQQARVRLFMASRAFPNAPAPYIRAVIANAMRSALRNEFRRFSTRSSFAEELDDGLPAPADEPVDERAGVVSAWAARLPIRLREVYRHLYTEERSQREVARLMGVSQPRVAQLHRQLIELGREELAHLLA